MVASFPAPSRSSSRSAVPTQGQAQPLHAQNQLLHAKNLELHAENRALLEAMGRCSHRQAALHWRNALVTANLKLVRMVAERQRHLCCEPVDDLVSMGVLGLIRAVEAFDLAHHGSLSSFAVPYIRGAMLHGLRDHCQPIRTPRRLRELQQRARRQVERLQQAGEPAPSNGELAQQLGCKPEQLEEAAAVQRALKVASLDAPIRDGSNEPEPGSLLDQLAAPAPEPEAPDANGQWLRLQLANLAPTEQRLLIGHWIEGLSWQQLAQELGLGLQAARSQGEALLRRLQEAAGQPSTASQPMAKSAAMAV
jgi:RNA polymerase sigma-B factor